jgi:hypothetical protein
MDFVFDFERQVSSQNSKNCIYLVLLVSSLFKLLILSAKYGILMVDCHLNYFKWMEIFLTNSLKSGRCTLRCACAQKNYSRTPQQSRIQKEPMISLNRYISSIFLQYPQSHREKTKGIWILHANCNNSFKRTFWDDWVIINSFIMQSGYFSVFSVDQPPIILYLYYWWLLLLSQTLERPGDLLTC